MLNQNYKNTISTTKLHSSLLWYSFLLFLTLLLYIFLSFFLDFFNIFSLLNFSLVFSFFYVVPLNLTAAQTAMSNGMGTEEKIDNAIQTIMRFVSQLVVIHIFNILYYSVSDFFESNFFSFTFSSFVSFFFFNVFNYFEFLCTHRYRTNSDGGNALKLLLTFVKNILDNPTEPK